MEGGPCTNCSMGIRWQWWSPIYGPLVWHWLFDGQVGPGATFRSGLRGRPGRIVVNTWPCSTVRPFMSWLAGAVRSWEPRDHCYEATTATSREILTCLPAQVMAEP